MADPISIPIEILVNIASQIIFNRARNLEDTSVAKILRWAGFIEQNLEERVEEILREAVRFYFNDHPDAYLSGIVTFFQDPDVAQQIAGLILSLQRPDMHKLEDAFVAYLGNDRFTLMLLKSRGLQPKQILFDFWQSYKKALALHLSPPQMLILDKLMEMEARQEKWEGFFDYVVKATEENTLMLSQIERVLSKHNRNIETSQTYYIGHDKSPANLIDLRLELAKIFEPPYSPVFSDQVLGPQSLLLAKFEAILLAEFCVFEITTDSPDVYVEVGIALALNRPTLILTKENFGIPPFLMGSDKVIRYRSFADLESRLLSFADIPGLSSRTSQFQNYCPFCSMLCESLSAPKDPTSYFVINNFDSMWDDIKRSIGSHLDHKYRVTPSYYTDVSQHSSLCELRKKIRRSRASIMHLGKLVDNDGLVALGLAIGSRVPWIILRRDDSNVPVPQDLQGNAVVVEYKAYAELEEGPLPGFSKLLDRVFNVKSEGLLVTKLPAVWQQLQDLVERVEKSRQVGETLNSEIRWPMVVYILGKNEKGYHTLSEDIITIGRSKSCQIIIDNPFVSKEHFRLSPGGDRRTYFIEDLNSASGTSIGKQQIEPHAPIKLNIGDIISIPETQFLVWDQRELPPTHRWVVNPNTTEDLTKHVLVIEPPATPPWPRGNRITLKAVLPDKERIMRFNIFVNYPLDVALVELSKHVGLLGEAYCFYRNGKQVGNGETSISLGLNENDLLAIDLTEIDSISDETQKKIAFCIHCEFSSSVQVKWPKSELRNGTYEFMQLSRLIQITHFQKLKRYPEDNVQIPLIKCPNCGKMLNDTEKVVTKRWLLENKIGG